MATSTEHDGPNDWLADLQCRNEDLNFVLNICETKSPNHAVLLLFHFFCNYVKCHAKGESKQQKPEAESFAEVVSEKRNPWFENDVYGLAGALLRKAQLVSPQHRKIRNDLSHEPSDHTKYVYLRKMPYSPATFTTFHLNDLPVGKKTVKGAAFRL